jgi:hypothetical protein
MWIMWFGADVSASLSLSLSALLMNFEPINGFSLNLAQTSTQQRPHYYILVYKIRVNHEHERAKLRILPISRDRISAITLDLKMEAIST